MIKKGLSLFVVLVFASCCYAQHQPIDKHFLLGQYEPAKDTAFVKVDPRYDDKPSYLQKETYAAFLKMYAAAKADKNKINLKIVSATRNFKYQNDKWGFKWSSKALAGLSAKDRVLKITRSFAMPTTSRHHWGTDIDLNMVETSYFNTPAGKTMYEWMQKNASKFGFYQPYDGNKARPGYMEEKWHWSYVPLSKIYLAEYAKKINYDDIKKTGVKGNEVAVDLDLIKKWVLGVNPACK